MSKGQPIAQSTIFGWVVAVTYGTASAPFLATRFLHQISLDCEPQIPELSRIIQNSFYMDDLMSGASSNKEAIILIQALIEALDARGFHLRKWRSNSQDVLTNISKNLEFNESNLEIHTENCSKALGLIWDSKEDIELWLLKLDWDDALPENFVLKWKKFQIEFQQVCRLSIPRWLQITNKQVTLHGFSDALEAVYACVVYAVQRNRETTKVMMLGGKSKVAPLTPICIPRLELNGALLVARFIAILCNCLKDHVINVYAWTDSQVVLSWMSSPPRNWKPFVANRTSEILDIIPCKQWCYVPSKENPAELGSRGMSPKDLPDCSLWWEGPQWLSTEEACPKQPTVKDKRDIEKSAIMETNRTFSIFCIL
ncbi:DUF1758 domain-containing protein [Trichonephila inaurata madagascariensis]|uniref:DUF1758 domain-containing protein n=1 Tax=Trichonephila inaurata madagascariensis TaxID=2747483 RepID=A0A8X6IBJ9_9ARAC|nr:DUF1758 domain-containing protein [Trichonephila inaurata madagascariensis]